jgi:hypothetical protein
MFPFYNWGGSDGGAGAPSGSTYTTGITVGSHPSDPNYGFQIANNMWNTGLWVRGYNNAAWNSWVRLLDSSNYSSYALPLSGGTLTGTLYTPKVIINANSDLSWGGNYGDGKPTIAASTNTLYFYPAGNVSGATLLLSSSATNSIQALQQNGNQVLHAGNYSSYSVATSGGAAKMVMGTYGPQIYPTTGGGSSGGGWARSMNFADGSSATNFANFGALGGINSIDYAFITVGTDPTNYNNTNALRVYSTYAGWGTNAFLHAGNYSSYALPIGGGTLTGTLFATVGVAVNNGSGAGYGINLYSGSAYQPTYGIFFAQTGNFGNHGALSSDWATYFTMNDDVARGWIFRRGSTNVASISGAGSAVFNAGVAGFSDERVKTNWKSPKSTFLQELAKVKSGTYDRTDQELTQDGVSAQSLQKVLPHSVLEDNEGNLSVTYGNAALVAAIELAKANLELQKRIARLEALVEKLIEG